MRIATGGISHETSTFVKSRTTVRDFESGFGLFRGAGVIERFRYLGPCSTGKPDAGNDGPLAHLHTGFRFGRLGFLFSAYVRVSVAN